MTIFAVVHHGAPRGGFVAVRETAQDKRIMEHANPNRKWRRSPTTSGPDSSASLVVSATAPLDRSTHNGNGSSFSIALAIA